ARSCWCLVLLLTWPPPRWTLFPYTTLFRSIADLATEGSRVEVGDLIARIDGSDLDATIEAQKEALDVYQASSKRDMIQLRIDVRSEEHTSELQSRENLVCRLLLEKKKIEDI